jgi:hypothetical protein
VRLYLDDVMELPPSPRQAERSGAYCATSHGLRSGTPVPSKSSTSRVTTVMP